VVKIVSRLELRALLSRRSALAGDLVDERDSLLLGPTLAILFPLATALVLEWELKFTPTFTVLSLCLEWALASLLWLLDGDLTTLMMPASQFPLIDFSPDGLGGGSADTSMKDMKLVTNLNKKCK
jgi:hypothetical protein